MTLRWMLALAVAASLAAATTALAQFNRRGMPSCQGDTPAQLESRRVALDAVRQIDVAAHRYKMLHSIYPGWKELAENPPVRLFGGLDLKWGDDEPVPDWRIHYVSDQSAFVFTLSGMRDKCGVTFVSDETDRILDGRDVQGRYGVVPLSTR